MKSLYITSVERYSGKTAVCLALGTRFQADGHRVGYVKPLSLQPYRMETKIVDEDATFVKQVLNLTEEAWELSPVLVTPESLREHLRHYPRGETDLMQKVKTAVDATAARSDILLLEGGASLREGYVVGLPTLAVAEELGSNVLIIVKYLDEVRVLDDVLASQKRLGKALTGVLINRVPVDASRYITEFAVPHLEQRGIPVFGVLPDVPSLAAITVGELINVLEAETLTHRANIDTMVEALTVGAMTAEAALSRFRKQTHKAVITGGDRTDIQLAALETPTSCLILTGNLRPSPLVVKQAEEFGIPVLLVRTNTMETIEKIERVFGKTRLGHIGKLNKFKDLLDQNFHFDRLYEMMGIEK